jgi:quercetin dioxygenase-like cupin family protein
MDGIYPYFEGAMSQRIYTSEEHLRFSDSAATVTEIVITEHSSIAIWGVRPGQEVPAHTHPRGQDTWVMLRGELTYYLGDGKKQTLRPGQFDVADRNQIHGALNEGTDDAVFLSIYSAPEIGYEKASSLSVLGSWFFDAARPACGLGSGSVR